jgi:hypothetical protein
MATIGENGKSQKQATLKTASSFAIGPGTARVTTAFMMQAPWDGKANLLIWWVAPPTFVKPHRLSRLEGARQALPQFEVRSAAPVTLAPARAAIMRSS